MVALSGYVDTKRDIPQPGPAKQGQPVVAPPPMQALKFAIYQTMWEQGVTQAALSEALGIDGRQVRRILDLDHNSRLVHLVAALRVLGKEVLVEVKDAA